MKSQPSVPKRLLSGIMRVISQLHRASVMVVGDLMVDEYLWGDVDRISPEAPVPVVKVVRETFLPGGAANVASNIRALGGKAFPVGVVGRDPGGEDLLKELTRRGISTSGIIIDPSRPTTRKTRIIAHRQQVVRVDREQDNNISRKVLQRILQTAGSIGSKVGAILVEDYGKGVVIPELIREVIRISKARRIFVTVDPKQDHFPYYRGVTCITPNKSEAGNAAGIRISDRASLKECGRKLLRELECDCVLITLGEDGMCLFENNKVPVHIPTRAREVFDVTGAGDTVIAVFTASLAAGASLLEAAHISNYAAAIVVGKVGTATVSNDELISAIKGLKA